MFFSLSPLMSWGEGEGYELASILYRKVFSDGKMYFFLLINMEKKIKVFVYITM